MASKEQRSKEGLHPCGAVTFITFGCCPNPLQHTHNTTIMHSESSPYLSSKEGAVRKAVALSVCEAEHARAIVLDITLALEPGGHVGHCWC